MASARLIPAFAVLMLCCACGKSSPGGGKRTPATADDAGSERAMDAAVVDAGHASRSGTGGRTSAGKLDAGRTKTDAGRKTPIDGGDARDATQAPADPSECAGVHCAPPTVCERDAGLPHCVCPPGYDFVDLGGSKSPCVPHCEADCDAG